MNNQTNDDNARDNFLSSKVEGFGALVDLAIDLRWAWNHNADKLWQKIDSDLWDCTQEPWGFLRTVQQEQLKKALGDPSFRKDVNALLDLQRQTTAAPAWFQKNHSQSCLTCVAYFSMEFMLCEALPIYSGGLGNVAGDQLKAYSDLGVPVVGVGLLYQKGYFRQVIGKDGSQQALYPYNDPRQLPITPLLQANGEPLRLEIAMPGCSVWLRAWQAQVGRVKLYLLDSNDTANSPANQEITGELYGGGPEMRLNQELLLGIGGWRLLNALGIKPEVCHLNEGHAAFAVLERARTFMEETGQSFEVALATTRAGNIFTTHTAVAAGFDRFTPGLIEHYLSGYAQKLGISLYDLQALGRQNPNDSSESFNMAYLAIRGSKAVNGVSRLHGKVSRHLFKLLFPRWSVDEVPIGHVTNGVHMPTWDSAAADDLWTQTCGKERWLGSAENMEQEIRGISDVRMWKFRTEVSQTFIEYVRGKLSRQLTSSGASPEEIDNAKKIFNPKVLTLGFARRFATYKRPNMLLHDPQRLLRLLTNSKYPVQLIMAGKAHPADLNGQALIKKWIEFIQQPEVREHVVFLSDYDMLLAEHMVQGVDVWINTPRRPWEASGTSGMKVLVNGGINLSELDGWWAEAYASDLGWSLGDGKEHDDESNWDLHEAEELYNRLEQEVIPEFYSRNEKNIPTAWVRRMRESMARLTPAFSTNRTVRDYTEEYYIPAARAYHERSANKGAAGKNIINWKHILNDKWGTLRFGEVKVETKNQQHVFEVQLYLNELDPNAVRLELYADGVNGGKAVLQKMKSFRQLPGVSGGYIFRATVGDDRSSSDYTARVIPHFDGVAVPLEDARILWQR